MGVMAAISGVQSVEGQLSGRLNFRFILSSQHSAITVQKAQTNRAFVYLNDIVAAFPQHLRSTTRDHESAVFSRVGDVQFGWQVWRLHDGKEIVDI